MKRVTSTASPFHLDIDKNIIEDELVYEPPANAKPRLPATLQNLDRASVFSAAPPIVRQPFVRANYDPVRNVRRIKSTSTQNNPTRPHGFDMILWFYQMQFLSFFGYNQDSLVKIFTLLLTIIFIAINIAVHVPCLMNCVYDLNELLMDGISRELLIFTMTYLKLCYVLVVQIHLLRKGGLLRFAFKRLERYSDQYRVGECHALK